MSVAVERRTVRLWPVDASPLSSLPARPRKDPATEALAAITSRYRRGREGIIAGDSSPSTGQLGETAPAHDAPPTHFATVPLAFLPKRMPTEVVPEGLQEVQADEAPTFWSRLVRSRRPAPRGRHSPKS